MIHSVFFFQLFDHMLFSFLLETRFFEFQFLPGGAEKKGTIIIRNAGQKKKKDRRGWVLTQVFLSDLFHLRTMIMRERERERERRTWLLAKAR